MLYIKYIYHIIYTMSSLADQGAMFVNDVNGVVRKILPGGDGQTLISNSNVNNGVTWGTLYQAKIPCDELDAVISPIGANANDYSPAGYTGITSSILIYATVNNANLNGLYWYGQCFIFLTNAGVNTIRLFNEAVTSLSFNRFSLNTPLVVLQPKASLMLHYSNTLFRWSLVSPNTLYLDDLVDVKTNGGIGDQTGDRLTYVKNNLQVGGYPFIISPDNWTNISVVSGAITFDNTAVPLIVPIAGNNIATLIPFVGVLQPGGFLVTTNGLGRLINSDQFYWNFNINFSCSITGSANSEWDIDLRINGVVASNSQYTTIITVNRYISVAGVWTAPLRGSSASGAPFNQYCEIFVTRRSGVGNATFGSCYLSITGVKLLDRP